MRGGVVVRMGEETFFVPAEIASKVVPLPDVARMPGAPAELQGVALVDGAMIPVLAIGREMPRGARRPMLVCTVLGEKVGLVGMEIVASGRFESAPDGVECNGVVARELDVAAAIARVREGRWAV